MRISLHPKLTLSFLTLASLLFFFTAQSQYYWVGGSGDWSDFANHWATTSGGTSFHTQEPTETDDVYFDFNSFDGSGQVVTMDLDPGKCRSLDWTGVTNFPSFESFNFDPLEVYGSLTLSPDMTYNVSVIEMRSTETGNTITCNGNTLGSSAILRLLGTGEFTLTDTFEADRIQMHSGTFITGGNTINLGFSITLNADLAKTIDLGSSTLNIQQWRTNGSNNTIIPGTSTINTSSFYADSDNSGPYTYNNVTFADNTAIMEGSGVFNVLDISNTAGNYFKVESGTTITCNDLIGVGTRHVPLDIYSSIEGSEATFVKSSGSVDLEFVIMQDIHASGGASFNVADCEDKGNNTGWNITPIVNLDFFWVGDGGDWEDFSHWSNTSGGAPFYSDFPSQFDNVIFDANSFSMAGQTVSVNDARSFKNFNASGVTNSPTLDAGYLKPLNAFGSVNFTNGIFKSINNLNLKGYDSHDMNFGSQGSLSFPTFSGGGVYTLAGDVNCGSLTLIDGTLNTAGFTVDCSIDFKESNSNSSTLNLGSSTIYCRDFIIQSTNTTLDPGTSNIVVERDFKGNELSYYKVTLVDDGSLFYSNTYDYIEFAPGVTSSIEAGTVQTVFSGIMASGTPESPVNISSTETGTQATLSMSSGTVVGLYLILSDSNASGGATFNAEQSIDNGNNTGWNITEITPQDFYWVGGTGNWSDAANHWAATSGGSDYYDFIPGVLDNVIFDANSFGAAGQTVNIDLDEVNCHDMDWSDATNAPHLEGSVKTINVYGSLWFNTNMTANVTNYNFLSAEPEEINPAFSGSPGANSNTTFNSSGTWNVYSAITVRSITLENGTLLLNGNDTHVDFETVFNGDNIKVLDFQGCDIYSRSLKWNTTSGSNLTVNGMNSAFTCSSTFTPLPQIAGDNLSLTLHDLIIGGSLGDQGNISSEITLNTLTILPGKSLEIWSGMTVTVNQLICEGTALEPIEIKGQFEGDQCIISQATGTVDGQYLELKDISGTGGATFYANNSINNGNVSGWIFSGASQSITFDPIDDVMEDVGTFALTATASSGLEVLYSIVSGPATVDGNMLTIIGPGPVEVQATQPGNAEFNPAPSVTHEFCSIPLQPEISGSLDEGVTTLVSSSDVGNQWYDQNGIIVGATDQILEVTEPGIYTVQVDVGGCVSDMSEGFEVIAVGVEEQLDNLQLLVYPNPASDQIYIKGITEGQVDFFNAQGQLIINTALQNGEPISVTSLSSGLYILNVKTSAENYILQFLKH